MSTKAYKVTIMNYGEPMIAYHYNKTKKEILEGYALEGLKVIKIEKCDSTEKSAIETMLKWEYNPGEIDAKVDNRDFTEQEKKLIQDISKINDLCKEKL